ncbi:MAG: hypothetical protein J5768_00205 [Spirochaetales bacterium]|nr:hypothetical protein [Spirochaetales bacterium]MBO4423911.1 hypothetical protein [Spirochaetales bacterium]
MKTRLNTEEKQYLEDALSRLREGDRLINQGKSIKDEARSFIIELLDADITEPRPQVYTTDDGRKLIINGTINRNVNPEALEFFMEKEHPELKERLGRAFYPKWELSKKEWDRLSDEERALLMGEMVVTENIGTAKLTVK